MSRAPDAPRLLGVIECFAAVVRQCPKAAARAMAESALGTIEREGSRVLAEQAYLVLSALHGWHGERAVQVKRSLQAFLRDAERGSNERDLLGSRSREVFSILPSLRNRRGSMAHLHVAIAGATGAVGAEFLRLLEKRQYPIDRLTLLASKRSVGRTLRFCGEELPVSELTPDAFRGVDHAFFSAGGSQSLAFAPAAAAAGAVVIDNSSAFRYDDEVPLVIPEINPDDVFQHRGIIANPNCTTIVTLMAVAPLHRAFGLRRAVSSSYQAISGAGAQAMAELEQQVHDWVAGRSLEVKHQPKQIAFNVIPRIDAVQDNFYTKEEMKLVWESRKILHHAELLATATCVRVPVFRSHSVSLNLEFEQPITRGTALDVLRGAPGLAVQDDPAAEVYPTPLEVSEIDEVFVGRVREDISVPGGRGLALWAVGDQLAKGAALNAVQIGELLLRGR